MSNELHVLHAELEALTAEQARLETARERQRAENARLAEALSTLTSAAGHERRRWWLWIGGVVLLGGSWIGYQVLRERAETQAMMGAPVYRPAHPHLLVTAKPVAARISINGEDAGMTPLFEPLLSPKSSRRMTVDVQAFGYRPERRTVEVTQRGAHLHVVLEPCRVDGDGAACATGR